MSVLQDKYRKKFNSLSDEELKEQLADPPENPVALEILQEIAEERGLTKKAKKAAKAEPPAKKAKAKKQEEEEEEESEEEEEEEEAPKKSKAGKAGKAKKQEEDEEEESEEEEDEAPKKSAKKVAPPKAGKKSSKDDEEEDEAPKKKGRKPSAEPIPEKKYKRAYEDGEKVKFAATARQEAFGYTAGKPITATVISATRCPRTGLAYYKLEFKDKNTKEACRTNKLESAILVEE